MTSNEKAMWNEYRQRASPRSVLAQFQVDGSRSKHRQLYASILPSRESIAEGKATGICQVGWENKQCTTFHANEGTTLKNSWGFCGGYGSGLASLLVVGVALFWMD